MKNKELLCLAIFVIIVFLLVKKYSEKFEIEPNTIAGGYNSGPAMFQLDGPGYPDGY